VEPAVLEQWEAGAGVSVSGLTEGLFRYRTFEATGRFRPARGQPRASPAGAAGTTLARAMPAVAADSEYDVVGRDAGWCRIPSVVRFARGRERREG
jgi:hypothetical protein